MSRDFAVILWGYRSELTLLRDHAKLLAIAEGVHDGYADRSDTSF